jgi:hypothetical protein
VALNLLWQPVALNHAASAKSKPMALSLLPLRGLPSASSLFLLGVLQDTQGQAAQLMQKSW